MINNFLWKLFHSTKYYFITSVRIYKENGVELTDSRTWGFYKSKKTAFRAVQENWTDMNENGYYPWVVIEEVHEGLLDVPLKVWWFEQDRVLDKEKDWYYTTYKPIEPPEFSKGICNWSMG